MAASLRSRADHWESRKAQGLEHALMYCEYLVPMLALVAGLGHFLIRGPSGLPLMAHM